MVDPETRVDLDPIVESLKADPSESNKSSDTDHKTGAPFLHGENAQQALNAYDVLPPTLYKNDPFSEFTIEPDSEFDDWFSDIDDYASLFPLAHGPRENVGTSQGLHSHNYKPSRPLDVLTKPCDIPVINTDFDFDADYDGGVDDFDFGDGLVGALPKHNFDNTTLGDFDFYGPDYTAQNQFQLGTATDLYFGVQAPPYQDFPLYTLPNSFPYDAQTQQALLCDPQLPQQTLSYDPDLPLPSVEYPPFELPKRRLLSFESDSENVVITPSLTNQALPIFTSTARPVVYPPPRPEDPVVSNTKKYYGEVPESDPHKSWVRTNASTRGKTSRTGKINHYNASQHYTASTPARSSWRTTSRNDGDVPSFRFSYDARNELKQPQLSALQIQEFIRQHPSNLTLWMQRAPADSKRRYPSTTLDKCRFSACPMRACGHHGNMTHGHYRVSLDEHAEETGEEYDPFLVAGYVHLYCLERFLDLPSLCRLPHVAVKADNRQQMTKEPNGTFAAALGAVECSIANVFLEACRAGTLHSLALWRGYPRGGGASKEDFRHKFCLNYVLQKRKNQNRSARVIRSLKLSTVAVHRGDLELFARARKQMLSQKEVAKVLEDLDGEDCETVLTSPSRKRKIGSSPENASPDERRPRPRTVEGEDVSPLWL